MFSQLRPIQRVQRIISWLRMKYCSIWTAYQTVRSFNFVDSDKLRGHIRRQMIHWRHFEFSLLNKKSPSWERSKIMKKTYLRGWDNRNFIWKLWPPGQGMIQTGSSPGCCPISGSLVGMQFSTRSGPLFITFLASMRGWRRPLQIGFSRYSKYIKRICREVYRPHFQQIS